MRYIVFTLVVLIGCSNQPPTLDWEKTADAQNFKIGDIIIVEGETFDPIGNPLKLEWDSDEKTHYWVKKGWESKTHVSVYKPSENGDDYHPNDPIGVVVCTVYNPSAYDSLKRIDDMYPERSKGYLYLIHRIRFIGKIYSFERYFVKSYGENPDYYLAAVRIHVTAIEVLESKKNPILMDKNEEDIGK